MRREAIFISYRRDDCLDEARALREYLVNTFDQESLIFLDERSIQLTDAWRKRIKTALERAEVMLCLIGPKWIESFKQPEKETELAKINDWVQYEIQTARKECIDVIPVFLKQEYAEEEGPRERLGSEIQAVLDSQGFYIPKGSQEKNFAEISKSLYYLLNPGMDQSENTGNFKKLDPLASLPLPIEALDWLDGDEEKGIEKVKSPYPGPIHFRSEHAALFFGREKEIRKLFHLIRRHRLVLLDGYSGAGKSSLLHAGLLPRMQAATPAAWKVYTPIRRNKQTGGLAIQLDNFLNRETDVEGKKELLILDQVEEMYTDPLDRAEIENLGRKLKEALFLNPCLHIILAFRSEYYQKIVKEFVENNNLFQYMDDMYLGPMDQKGMEAAILKPTTLGGKFKFIVEEDLVNELTNKFSGDDFLPYGILLQIQLLKLWEEASGEVGNRRRDGKSINIDKDLYEKHQLGGIKAFIKKGLDNLTEQAEWKSFMDAGLGLDILYAYTTKAATAGSLPDEAFHRFYQREGLDTEALLQALKRAYILTSIVPDGEEDVNTESSRLVHDTLAPIIRDKFFLSDKAGQRALRIIETKEQDDLQGFEQEFSETDLDTIEAGQAGMRNIPPALLQYIARDKVKYFQQKVERQDRALNRARTLIENLQFGEAISELEIADKLRIRPLRVRAMARHLEWPLRKLASGKARSFEDALNKLDRFFAEIKLKTFEHGSKFEIRQSLRFFPKMIKINGGVFEMGIEETKDPFGNESPKHGVEINDFYIAETPITHYQFNFYCLDQDLGIAHDSGFGRGTRPVININWYRATQYCNWLSRQMGFEEVYKHKSNGELISADINLNGFRLPTEAEWEFAARERGQSIRFGNGKDLADTREMNFDGAHKFNRSNATDEHWFKGPQILRSKTTPVKQFLPNKLGLYDMAGNVYEWCWDWYDEEEYKRRSFLRNHKGLVVNPIGSNRGDLKVFRGGSWYTASIYCRNTYRNRNNPNNHFNHIGFRIARRQRN